MSKTTYTCTKCNIYYPQWFGQCRSCREWGTIKEGVLPKKDTADKEWKDNLDKWFNFQNLKALIIPKPCCENCGESVLSHLKCDETWIKRSVHAHIIPKTKYKSVSTNKLNHLLLCGDCHSQFDSSWTNAKKMKVWKVAVERAKQFSILIEEASSRLPEEFFV